MKPVRMALLGAVAAAGLSLSALPAAADAVRFSFDVGNVRAAYSDGYWDNDHHWHKWRNAREHRAFRESYHDRYVAERHSRYRNAGWRDSDHDGVPDRI